MCQAMVATSQQLSNGYVTGVRIFGDSVPAYSQIAYDRMYSKPHTNSFRPLYWSLYLHVENPGFLAIAVYTNTGP